MVFLVVFDVFFFGVFLGVWGSCEGVEVIRAFFCLTSSSKFADF